MPKLWTETIEAHRHEVRDAALDATAALVAKHGLLSVTMSQVAEETGIGRATLYKYFSDVKAILVAWHNRHIARHFAHLHAVRNRAGSPGERLEAVLEAYALSIHARPQDTELAALVHRGGHFAGARRQLHDLIRDLAAEAAASGTLREDIAPEELAAYCLHALEGANSLPSQPAVRRLVTLTLAGLAPVGQPRGHRSRRSQGKGDPHGRRVDET